MEMSLQASEAERLNALRSLNLLDTPPSDSFDRITRMASRIFDLPIAAVSLTDSDRQWFKSRVGVEHWSLPRDRAPCAQVSDGGAPVVIPDLTVDPVYCDSPLAQSGVRFYAGAPLTTGAGHTLGAMCVLGMEARETTPAEMAALSDLAAMVMAQVELEHAFGRIDAVSGLPNRTQFMEDLHDLARDRPSGEHRYLVLVDVATRKQLNAAARVMGPDYLDDLARDAARTIKGGIGPTRKLYHIAATQMAFLSMPDMDEENYLLYLKLTLAAFRSYADSRFVTTTAVGVTPLRLGETSPDDGLRQAYSAAQDARSREGRVSLYSPSLDEAHKRRFTLVNHFGDALSATDQLRLVYQPRVDIPTGACLGAEVLLRWRHPTLGEVSPAEFIPLVERTALARATTAWVLDGALRQAAAWRAQGLELKLSVNMSAANLEEADFVERLHAGLAQHGVPPSGLELELTESAMMSDSNAGLASLTEISAMGVDLAIDDFGTGYSSLSYLQALPAQVLKIDQSFMRDLARDERKQALVRTMITLAQQFDYRVVAEGVEEAEVLALLSAAGCDEAQGYLFAKPLAPAGFSSWLERWSGRDRVAA